MAAGERTSVSLLLLQIRRPKISRVLRPCHGNCAERWQCTRNSAQDPAREIVVCCGIRPCLSIIEQKDNPLMSDVGILCGLSRPKLSPLIVFTSNFEANDSIMTRRIMAPLMVSTRSSCFAMYPSALGFSLSPFFFGLLVCICCYS